MKTTIVALLAALTFTCAKDELPHSNPNSSIQGSRSGPTATGQAFTGRTMKNEEALKLADCVFVGRIVDFGERDFGAPGQAYYGNVKVEVTQTIKGTASKAISLALTVQQLPVEHFEETPKIGNKYIFFVQGLNPKALRAKKLLEATEENLTKISALARSTTVKN